MSSMLSAPSNKSFSGRGLSLQEGLGRILGTSYLPWTIMGVGMLYRLMRYVQNPALWLDEAMLARNFLDTGLGHLFGPLLHDQFAPIGYLVATWGLVSLLGPGEYVLRLLPLIASLASVAVFWKVARGLLSRNAAVASLVMFCLAPRPTYYASEAKQYGLEVLISLLLFWLYLVQRRKANTVSRTALFSVCGAVALCFSFTTPFVLGGIGAALGLKELRERSWKGAAHVGLMIAVWLGTLGLYWITIIVRLPRHVMTSFWHDAFLPLPPTSLQDAEQILNALSQFCHDPLGLSAVSLSAFLCSLGILVLAKNNMGTLTALVIPLLLTLLASGLRLYPFNGRLLLFYVPLVILVFGAAVDYLHRKAGAAVSIIAMIVLLFHPTCLALENVFVRDTPQGLRNAFSLFAGSGETLVPAPVSIPEFNYYAYRSGYLHSGSKSGARDFFPWPPTDAIPAKRFLLVETMLILTDQQGRSLPIVHEKNTAYRQELEARGSLKRVYADQWMSIYLYQQGDG